MVVAEHHAQLRIGQIGSGVVLLIAIHVRDRRAGLCHAIAARLLHEAAVAVAEALQEVGDVLRLHAACRRDEHGFGTVFIKNALVVLADGVNGFFPADLLVLTASASAHALHGILQAIGVVDPPAHRTATQACANLMIAEFVGTRVVGFHAHDLVVTADYAQGAAAIAVRRAMRPGDRFFSSAVLDGLLFAERGAAARYAKGSECAHTCGRLHERTATDRRRFYLLHLPFCSSLVMLSRTRTQPSKAVHLQQRTSRAQWQSA